MIQVQGLSKSYGTQLLFEGVTFLVERGERIGVLGRNGHGKTTLFRLILGAEEPDAGTVVVPRGYRIGHLAQRLEFRAPTVLAEAAGALPADEDGVDRTYRAEATLAGLGFDRALKERAPGELSGGYQVRLQLARVLLSEPDLLLLDEPGNYLDIVSLRWLERFLRDWKGELLLISHDRGFLDSVTTHTLSIHRGQVRKVAGSTGKVLAQIATEEEVHEKTRQNLERERRQAERFIERFRAKASKAKAVQSRIKQLERKGSLDRLEEIAELSFSFRHQPIPAQQLLEADELSFAYDGGPALFEGLSFGVGAHERIGVVGPNGRGKSTLLSVLAGERSPLRGRVRQHPSTRIAYFGQGNVDRLDASRTVEEEILTAHPDHDRTDARGICGLMMFEGDAAEKPIQVLSGGERCRVLLGKLLVAPANLLLLDEPTNHLDLQASEGLLEALRDFGGALVLVTHSELLLHELATRLVVFDGGRVRVFEGSYQDFLDQVGWVEEGAAGTGEPAAPASAPSRKELRRLRAEVIAEKSAALKPLARRVSALEEEITALEGEVATVQERIVAASTAGVGAEIATLSRRAHELDRTLQERLGEYERVGTELEQAEAHFAARLAELGE